MSDLATTVKDIYRKLDELAPFRTAYDWDNVGLLIGSMDALVTGVLTALDATEAVVDEAVSRGSNLIVTHHPVIFSPLKRIETASIAYKLIGNGINVISAHTNLDMANGGVNDVLADLLGLQNIRPFDVADKHPWYKVSVYVPIGDAEQVYQAMADAGAGKLGDYSGCGFLVEGEGRFLPADGANPHVGEVGILEHVRETKLEMLVDPDLLSAVLAAMRAAHPYEEPAYDIYENHAVETVAAIGRIGDLPEPISPEQFARRVKARIGASGVKFAPGAEEITTAAVLGGSGAKYIHLAQKLGAQALLTGESKHDLLLEASRIGVTLVDAGHFATEVVVIDPLTKLIQDSFPELAVARATADTDPVKYIG